jgi:uncharacterized protein YndB with AHSA1/START domain
MISKGYFVIADITGYTEFLAQSGLEEAHGILDHLFDRFLDAFESPLTISNFQGDAVLSFAPDGSFTQGQTFFDLIENIYYRFVSLIEQMERNAACTCNACDNLPKLDLKLFVHHGEYAIQKIRDRQELTGPDVILAHRMMKNNVRQVSGLRSYALLSEKALQSLAIAPELYGMVKYEETYEHLGALTMYVHDLRARFESTRDQRRSFVPPDKADISVEKLIPALPSQVWEYLTLPAFVKEWMAFETVDSMSDTSGKPGPGTAFRCKRRTEQLEYLITDWRPFSYLTMEATAQADIRYETSFVLIRRDDGTLLRLYCRFLYQVSSEITDTIQAAFDTSLDKLQALVDVSQRHALS